MTTHSPVAPISAEIIGRLRILRKLTRVSAQELADGITALGFPVSRSTIANSESERKATLSLDYAVLAAQVLGSDLGALLAGPAACPTCKGEPHPGFTCNTCGVTS
jgi:transcriptional regulator with XRE-family HTH domain